MSVSIYTTENIIVISTILQSRFAAMAKRASWSLLAPKELLKQFLLMHVLRRHVSSMSYDLMAARWPDLFNHFPICIAKTSSGASGIYLN